MAKRNPSRTTVTLSDFERTGWQDCANVMTTDDFLEYMRKHPKKTPSEVVDAVWKQYEDDGIKEEWISQMDPVPGLKPDDCYRWWRDGWKACARLEVEGMARAIAKDDD